MHGLIFLNAFPINKLSLEMLNAFIHTLFPPAGDTCNNKHQITNIMTSMILYIHYVRKRERKKILYTLSR